MEAPAAGASAPAPSRIASADSVSDTAPDTSRSGTGEDADGQGDLGPDEADSLDAALASGSLGEGAAISLYLFPLLVAVSVAMLVFARRAQVS